MNISAQLIQLCINEFNNGKTSNNVSIGNLSLAEYIAQRLIQIDGKPFEKVSMNLTRPALERLIGGDSELEINLRHNVAKAIIDKLIVPTLLNQTKDAVLNKIIKEIKDELFVRQGFFDTQLIADLKKQIKSEVEHEIKATVNAFDLKGYAEIAVKGVIDNLVRSEYLQQIADKVRDLKLV